MIKLKNLRKLREKTELTQTELAAKIGVTARTIDRWENGKNIPHRERMKKLNRILGQLLKGHFTDVIKKYPSQPF